MTKNIHATAVDIDGKGVLLIGAPGSGKSDLAFRLIMNKNAVLIADDRVDIFVENGVLKATCPENIKGLLEVRGIGICKFPFHDSVEIKLVVQLEKPDTKIERLPNKETTSLMEKDIPLIRIHSWEASSPDKIIIACYQNT